VRRLAERYATPRRRIAAWDADAGLEAARRAVRTRTLPAPVRGAHVVDLFPAPHPALNWGGEDLLTAFHAIDPTATGTVLNTEPADPAALVDGIVRAGAPLIVATSDAGLHPWQARLRDTLAAWRPDAVLVDTGLPEGGALCSYGRGKVNLRAVAEVLAGA
jgi:beta-N-acetylhexosaminidase